MAKVDISPYLPQIEAQIEACIAPPLYAWEPMLLLGKIGEILHAAEDLETEDDYKDAWSQLTIHAIDKYDIFGKLDELIKLPFYFEPFDGPALRKAWDAIGVALAHAAAKKLA